MTFYEIIYKWVADNFGQAEADSPSWSIKELANKLSKSDINPDELSAHTKSDVYNTLDQCYVEEDVENYARNKAIELTDQQITNVATKIRRSDWYCSISGEDMDYYIEQELKKGENNHE